MNHHSVVNRATPFEWVALVAVWILLIFSSWFWAGADTPALPFLRCGFLLTCAVFLLACIHNTQNLKTLRLILKDPLIWPSILLLIYLACQGFNAFWLGTADQLPKGTFWFDGTPNFSKLPSTVFSDDAELVFWKAAYALTVALLIRNGIHGKTTIHYLYIGIITNSLLLSIFGFAFIAHGTEKYYGTIEVARPFFGSFFYNNHAGQYLYLAMACILALLLRPERKKRKRPNHGFQIYMLISGLMCSLALFAIVSRVALAIGFTLLCLSLPIYLKTIFLNHSATKRLYVATTIAGVMIAGLLVIQALFATAIDRKLKTAHKKGFTAIEEITTTRAWQWQTAVRMWSHRKAYGSGSGSYPYFCIFYIPNEYRSSLTAPHAGHVHNDFLQTLCQQGVIGIAMITGIAVIILSPLKNINSWKNPLILFPTLSCLLLFAHSMIDTPFSSTGVTTLFMTLLTASTKTVQLQ